MFGWSGNIMTRKESYLVLNSLRQIGPVRVRKLREALGSVEAILMESPARLAKIDGIGPGVAESVSRWESSWNLEEEKTLMERLGVEAVDWEDEHYPAKLKEIYDPPLVLYYRGNLDAVGSLSIGVVGSRRTSYYGMEMAKKLSYQMAYAGLTVTSGLARGIDTAAHQGALAAKGKTAAVFGCSLDRVYPSENEALADRIVQDGGVLISEFPLGTPPDRQTFPMRNRIVSGLSGGVLVVEAGKSSGALITAQMAADQGRTVFAVPGRIDQSYSQGCHMLIKEGAKLVESVEDILDEFSLLFQDQGPGKKEESRVDLSPEEKVVLEGIGDSETHLDVVIRKCGLPTSKVFSTLLRLEMKKLVQQLPGKFFLKIN